MCRAILQNRIASDVLTAARGAIIKTECCIYGPDYHKNICGFLTDMNTQTGTLEDPSLSFSDQLNYWTRGGFFLNYQRTLTWAPFSFVILIMFCCFLPCLSTRYQYSHCRNFKPTDNPLHLGRSTHAVSLGFNCLCLS